MTMSISSERTAVTLVGPVPAQGRGRAEAGLAAVEAIHREHFAFVWRSLRHLGVPHAWLEDAAQEVFVVVHRRIGEFEGRADVKTWLYAIARRVASDQRRSMRRADRKHAALLAEGTCDHDDFVDPVVRSEAAQHVVQFLEGLDGDKRAVFTLHAFEGLRGPEIAERLAMNLNSVYSRLRVAKERFEQSCRALGVPEDDAVAATSAAIEPRPDQRTAAWLVLLPQLRGTELVIPTTVAVGSLSAKLWVSGAALLGVLAIGGWQRRPAPPEVPATERVDASTIAVAAEPPRDAATTPLALPMDEPAVVVVPAMDPPAIATPAIATTSAVAAAPRPATARAPRRPRPAEITAPEELPPPEVSAPKPAPPAPATVRPSIEPLTEELAMIAAMRTAFVAGDHRDVLARVADHAARFPNGRLATQRRAYEAIARCSLGQLRRGRAIADRYLAAHREAVLATGVRGACYGAE
jgi:RNA polymerase sigma-70 factor (ECF subfamily)